MSIGRRTTTGWTVKLQDILNTSLNWNTLYVSAEELLQTTKLTTSEQAKKLGDKCISTYLAKYKWKVSLVRVVHIDLDKCSVSAEFVFVLTAILKKYRIKYRYLANTFWLTDLIRLTNNQRLAEKVCTYYWWKSEWDPITCWEITKKRLTDLQVIKRGKRRDALYQLIKWDIRESINQNRYWLKEKNE